MITGRDGCFSGGFDLAVMRSGQPDLVAALFAEGTRLYREIVEAPVPVVAVVHRACPGRRGAAPAGRRLPVRATRSLSRGPQRGEHRHGVAPHRRGHGHPPAGAHASSRRRRCSPRSYRPSGQWPWGSSTSWRTIRGPRLHVGRVSGPAAAGGFRGHQASYPRGLAQELALWTDGDPGWPALGWAERSCRRGVTAGTRGERAATGSVIHSPDGRMTFRGRGPATRPGLLLSVAGRRPLGRRGEFMES